MNNHYINRASPIHARKINSYYVCLKYYKNSVNKTILPYSSKTVKHTT